MAEKSAARLTALFWRGSKGEGKRGFNSLLTVKHYDDDKTSYMPG